MADATTAATEAVKQTSETALVVREISEQLGNAANVLGHKITEIIAQYGPDAVMMIREIGRIQAIAQVGGFLLSAVFFAIFFGVFFRYWRKLDAYYAEVRGNYSLKDSNVESSFGIRTGIFGVLSLISLLFVIGQFSLAAIYGMFSPEAFLIVKLLKW